MLIEHLGQRPRIDATAFVAPTAVVCGDVTIGPRSDVAFGAVVAAEGAPVAIGADCMIRENAVVKASPGHPVSIGDAVLVGPRASLVGCEIGDEAFLATGVAIFPGARLGRGVEVRVNAIVHVNTILEPGAMVPIGWIAVGNPATCLPPERHDDIWAIQQRLDFPKTAYGVDRAPDGSVDMRAIMRTVTQRHDTHRGDRILGRSDTASRAIMAAPTEIYRALLDRDALVRWLPPRGMTGRVDVFEPREGGEYQITLTYDRAENGAPGKTTEDADVTRGRFLELIPDRRVVQSVRFDSDDPRFAGEMRITWQLDPAPDSEGTLVTVTADDVPRGIAPEDHQAGFASTLNNLARFVEPGAWPHAPMTR